VVGRVLDGDARVPMEVAVGDSVEYLIVSEKDVLAVVGGDGSRRA
jgi:co-chaperonin GroES (HSP10)